MYKLSNISVIIPTYNRARDLNETIRSIPNIKEINEILIIDQSTTKETEKLIKSLKNKKIKYIHSNIPSLTKARNLGVKKVSKSSKLVCFIDDDVTLSKNYFDEILSVFNNFSEAKGVAAFQEQKQTDSKHELFLKKLFFLGHLENNSARVISTYGNTYPLRITSPTKAEWLSGVNMVYKKEIFEIERFDENLIGYALAEDLDFSYRVHKRFPDSLFLTPRTKIIHRASTVERYPTKKIAYVNQINHFYLNFKNFNSSFKEKLIFFWVLFGISITRILSFIKTRSKTNSIKLKLYFSSLVWCVKNIRKIKEGRLSLDY